MNKQLREVQVLGIPVTAENEDKILEYILSVKQNKTKKVFITTPNPEIVIYAKNHVDFKDILMSSDVKLADGVGLGLYARIMGKVVPPRITGVDFMNSLIEAFQEKTDSNVKSVKSNSIQPVVLGFFGGLGGVAEATAECLQKKHPGIVVGFAGEQWNPEKIKGGKLDILFVALGHPKQERWISENLDSIPASVVMGVGGAFDFIGGKVPRSPGFLRSAGLEWLFRLIVQPWRWKRQLALLTFARLTLQELFETKRNPSKSKTS